MLTTVERVEVHYPTPGPGQLGSEFGQDRRKRHAKLLED